MIRFHSSRYHADYSNKGYALVPGLISKDLINQITTFYTSLEEQDFPFFTSNWVEDQNYKLKVHNYLEPLLREAISTHIFGYKPVYSYFLTKKPSDATKVTIHQDWTLVDESKQSSLSVWIPLIDTDEKNGWFCVIPYSHKVFKNIRGSNIDMPYTCLGAEMEQELMIPVPMKAGDALFFDHRLVHYSPPNLSDTIRIAVGSVAIPDDAAMMHFYADDLESEWVFGQEVKDDFLLKYSFKQPLSSYFLDKEKLKLKRPSADYNLRTIKRNLLIKGLISKVL